MRLDFVDDLDRRMCEVATHVMHHECCAVLEKYVGWLLTMRDMVARVPADDPAYVRYLNLLRDDVCWEDPTVSCRLCGVQIDEGVEDENGDVVPHVHCSSVHVTGVEDPLDLLCVLYAMHVVSVGDPLPDAPVLPEGALCATLFAGEGSTLMTINGVVRTVASCLSTALLSE